MSGAPSDSYVSGLFRTSSAANLSRSIKRRQRIGRARPRRQPKQKAVKPPRILKIDQVAELLSEGLDLSAIAERMGITAKAAEHHFAAIRKQLGDQAR